jgi:RNA polymerase sigma factor (sigma-70 family)
VIIPRLADVLPDELMEALEEASEEEAPIVALDPRWSAAREAFIRSMDDTFGPMILAELSRQIARRKDGAAESAKDLHQKVRLVLCRQYDEHFAKTGTAFAPKKTYLRGVARNVARDHFKIKERKPAIERGVEVPETACGQLDPEGAARYAELLAAFERERERGVLTPEEVEVFEGRAKNDMTFPAIAAVLGRHVSTVHAQYRRAVDKLSAIAERVW